MFDIIIKKPQPITIREIQKLDVHDGDLVVFKYDGYLKPTAYNGFRQTLEEMINKPGVKARVIILDTYMSVHAVLHPSLEEEVKGRK